MKTDWYSTHKHILGGKNTSATGGHSHPLSEVVAAIAALDKRVTTLEETPVIVPPIIVPPPIVVPPPIIIPQPSWPTSLQAAINDTPSGGTLDLTGRPEPYRELIKITKPLTMIEPWVSGLASASDPWAIGIEITMTDHVVLTRPMVEDIRYCGIMVADSSVAKINGGWVKRVDSQRLNTNMNAYGVAVTDRGVRQSADVIVDGIEVWDVPNWHGLDTHGGLRIKFFNCKVHGANRAMFITSSAIGSAVECEISRCLMDTPTRRSDVPNTYPYNEVGLTIVSGCSAFGMDNRFDGWPSGNHIDTQGGPMRFTNSTVTNPK